MSLHDKRTNAIVVGALHNTGKELVFTPDEGQHIEGAIKVVALGPGGMEAVPHLSSRKGPLTPKRWSFSILNRMRRPRGPD